jgi:Replication protein A C terminal
MNARSRHREVRFEVIDGHLVRTSMPEGREPYQHRCTPQVYEAVAHAIDETPAQGEGVALDDLARGLNLPFTQVNVALEFMKERGVVVTRNRRNYPASNFAFEDAMVEYHALREKPGRSD